MAKLRNRRHRKLAFTVAVMAGCVNSGIAQGGWFSWPWAWPRSSNSQVSPNVTVSPMSSFGTDGSNVGPMSSFGTPSSNVSPMGSFVSPSSNVNPMWPFGQHSSFAEDSAHNHPSPGNRRPVPGGTCFPHIDNCATITKGAIPQPYGWFVHQWQNAQAAKAEADDFVIYKHEWYKGGTQLGPYGSYHLQQIVKRLPSVPFPVLIEVETLDPARNEIRRSAIVNCLAQAGYADPQSRVLLGISEPGGLYGDEAPRIYQAIIARQNPLFQLYGQGGGGGFGGGFGGLNTVPGGGTYGGFGGPPVAVPQNLP